MDIRYKGFYACCMKDSTEVKAVLENTIIAYVIPGVKKDVSNIIRPCKPSREWMDNTPGQEWAAQGKKPSMKDMWNSQYAKGRGSDDASVEHQTVFKCAPVVDERE